MTTTTPLRYTIGDVIREERIKRGISGKQLCRMAGVHHHAVCAIERGQVVGTLEIAERLLNAMGLELTVQEARQ